MYYVLAPVYSIRCYGILDLYVVPVYMCSISRVHTIIMFVVGRSGIKLITSNRNKLIFSLGTGTINQTACTIFNELFPHIYFGFRNRQQIAAFHYPCHLWHLFFVYLCRLEGGGPFLDETKFLVRHKRTDVGHECTDVITSL